MTLVLLVAITTATFAWYQAALSAGIAQDSATSASLTTMQSHVENGAIDANVELEELTATSGKAKLVLATADGEGGLETKGFVNGNLYPATTKSDETMYRVYKVVVSMKDIEDNTDTTDVDESVDNQGKRDLLDGVEIDISLSLDTSTGFRTHGYIVAVGSEEPTLASGTNTLLIQDVALDADDLDSGQIVAYVFVWVDGSHTAGDPAVETLETGTVSGKFTVTINNANKND